MGAGTLLVGFTLVSIGTALSGLSTSGLLEMISMISGPLLRVSLNVFVSYTPNFVKSASLTTAS
jgi:hypothetical protein